jgi:hypothetical protein
MCLTLAVVHALDHHGHAGLFWLCLGVGLGLRARLRQRGLTRVLLVGACLALAALMGWQELRTLPRVRMPHALQLLPGQQQSARLLGACQSLIRYVAAIL